MLTAKSALNYVDFMRKYFSRDILAQDGLFILPLGFKLPFRPEDFLTKKAAQYVSSPESKRFIESMVNIITDLDRNGVDDTIVVGFDIYLENVKRMKNSDLLVAITSLDAADVNFAKVSRVQITDDPNAQKVNLSDEEFVRQYPLQYSDVCARCRVAIPNFKQSTKFNNIMAAIESDSKLAFTRKLNPHNTKSSKTTFYAKAAVDEVIKRYTSTPDE